MIRDRFVSLKGAARQWIDDAELRSSGPDSWRRPYARPARDYSRYVARARGALATFADAGIIITGRGASGRRGGALPR